MPAAEPHPRRRALRRVLATAIASGALVVGTAGASPAGGQLLPTTTTEPAPATTEPEAVETTTTTEAEPAPTTTDAPTATTRPTRTTSRSSGDDEVDDIEDDGVVGSAEDFDEVVDDEVVDDEVEGDVAEETTSTARDLLVSGDGSNGAQSTTTTSTTLVEVAAEESSLDEKAQIWLVVAGLVVVAALIGVWTWRYWVRTKPAPVEREPDPTTVFHRT